MLFKATLASAATLLFAAQAMGATMNTGSDLDARAVLVATDKGKRISILLSNTFRDRFYVLTCLLTVSACNCPNNCSHKAGSSCKYRKDGTNGSPTIKGSKYRAVFRVSYLPNTLSHRLSSILPIV